LLYLGSFDFSGVLCFDFGCWAVWDLVDIIWFDLLSVCDRFVGVGLVCGTCGTLRDFGELG